jgi:ankyrin repeat protein
MRVKMLVIPLAVFAVFLFNSAALAQKNTPEDAVEEFFKDHRTEIEKIADDPGRMREYVLSQKDVNVRDKDGRTLLHYAAIKRYLPVVELLLKKGADINAEDDDRRTPLHEAMSYFAYDVAEFLVRNGADMTLKDKNGENPLFSVVYMDNEKKGMELLNLFIEKGFDVRRSADAKLLNESISRGHRDLALALLKKGIEFNDASLFAAVAEGYEDIFGLLLSKGASPKQDDILHAACGSGKLAIVKTLVEKGDMPTAKDADFALYKGHAEAAVYLNGVLKKMGGQPVDIKGRCYLKPEGGRCKALFFRGYYNPVTKSCREFAYGGCGGAVPFESVAACRSVCEDAPDGDRSSSPVDKNNR